MKPFFKVSHCCVSSSENPRFIVHVGDKILIRRSNTLNEVIVVSIESHEDILVELSDPPNREPIRISPESVMALML